MRASHRQKSSIGGTIGSLVDTHFRDRAGLQRIQELSVVAAKTSALIHELQKERGLSSGFVAGAGRRFLRDLPDQRLRTDRSLQEASEAWALIGPSPSFGSLEASLGEARTALADLSRFRSDIYAQALTPNAVVQRFSSLIDRLLVVIAEVPGTSGHPQVTMALIALFNFLLAKEYTGQLRALGSAVCAQSGFEPFQFERFQTLVHQREDSLNTFVRHAAREQLDRWAELLSSESLVQWDQFRRGIERSGRDSHGRLPTAEDWYRWSTAAIDTMRSAEIGLLDDLDALCLQILAETRSAWEDSQETPETLDTNLVLRLERAQIRLWEERRDLRRLASLPQNPDLSAKNREDLVQGLVEASATAAEELQRWRRELGRWDTSIRETAERAKQAKILALEATIKAFSPAQIATSARDLARGLNDLVQMLETQIEALKKNADKTLAAQELWHDHALALWKQKPK